MREVWNNLQTHWSILPPQRINRPPFMGIFALAYGEDAVQQYMAQNQGGGQSSESSSGCQTIDDCIYQIWQPRRKFRI